MATLVDGGKKVLTEPLLSWISTTGKQIVEASNAERAPNQISNSLCKLMCTLGDHSNTYIARKLVPPIKPLMHRTSSNISSGAHTPNIEIDPKVQEFLRLLLIYTGFPGWYGIDEEESELTLNFWYLLQESLWEIGGVYENDDEEELNWADVLNLQTSEALRDAVKGPGEQEVVDVDQMQSEDIQTPLAGGPLVGENKMDDGMVIPRLLYGDVISALKKKITWPTPAEMQASGAWDAGKFYPTIWEFSFKGMFTDLSQPRAKGKVWHVSRLPKHISSLRHRFKLTCFSFKDTAETSAIPSSTHATFSVINSSKLL